LSLGEKTLNEKENKKTTEPEYGNRESEITLYRNLNLKADDSNKHVCTNHSTKNGGKKNTNPHTSGII